MRALAVLGCIEGNAWLNSYADDLLHDLKLERERAERLERIVDACQGFEDPTRRIEAEARLARAVEALRPFADPYSWHHNYDGTGVIFQPEGAFYEKDWQAFIDKAAAVLAEQEKEQP